MLGPWLVLSCLLLEPVIYRGSQRTPGAVTLVEGVRKRNHGHLAFGDSYRVERCGAQNPLHRSRSNAVSAMSRKLGPCVHFLPSSELQGLD